MHWVSIFFFTFNFRFYTNVIIILKPSYWQSHRFWFSSRIIRETNLSWPVSFVTLILIKNCTIQATVEGLYRKPFFYLCSIYIKRDSTTNCIAVGVVVGPAIDFPRVSSRCSELNEVTDFQWFAVAWMTAALLANSALNLHSNVIKYATTFEIRVLCVTRKGGYYAVWKVTKKLLVY